MRNQRDRWSRATDIAALLLICLIWAWNSLRSDLFPGSGARIRVTPLVREALLLGIFAALAVATALLRKVRWPHNGALGRSVLVGLGIFVVPAIVNELGKGWITDSARVALFSLTPMFAMVFQPHLNSNAREPRAGLAAALIAVAGTFLVFPVDFPLTMASGFAFGGVLVSAISVAAANCVGVRLASDQIAYSVLGFASIAAAAAALGVAPIVLFFGNGHGTAAPFDPWAAPDLIALALLFWLMARMSPVQMTTRFLIAPLLANLAGLAILRPQVQIQAWIGLVFIAFGAGWLLRAPEGEPADTGSLLKTH
jgi:drug/metabolite transporter (DMT)-like permease